MHQSLHSKVYPQPNTSRHLRQNIFSLSKIHQLIKLCSRDPQWVWIKGYFLNTSDYLFKNMSSRSNKNILTFQWQHGLHSKFYLVKWSLMYCSLQMSNHLGKEVYFGFFLFSGSNQDFWAGQWRTGIVQVRSTSHKSVNSTAWLDYSVLFWTD